MDDLTRGSIAATITVALILTGMGALCLLDLYRYGLVGKGVNDPQDWRPTT